MKSLKISLLFSIFAFAALVNGSIANACMIRPGTIQGPLDLVRGANGILVNWAKVQGNVESAGKGSIGIMLNKDFFEDKKIVTVKLSKKDLDSDEPTEFLDLMGSAGGRYAFYTEQGYIVPGYQYTLTVRTQNPRTRKYTSYRGKFHVPVTRGGCGEPVQD